MTPCLRGLTKRGRAPPFGAPFIVAACAQRAPLPDEPEPPDEPELPDDPEPPDVPRELEEPDEPDEPDDPLIPPLELELPELPDIPPLELELPDEPLSESDDLLPLDAERSLLVDDERSLLLDAERSLLELPASPSPCDDDPLELDEPLMPPLLLLDDPEVFWSRSAMCFLLFPCGRSPEPARRFPTRPSVRAICLRIRNANCDLAHRLPRARMRALRRYAQQLRDRRRCLRR